LVSGLGDCDHLFVFFVVEKIVVVNMVSHFKGWEVLSFSKI
jgi:hypothetical protein